MFELCGVNTGGEMVTGISGLEHLHLKMQDFPGGHGFGVCILRQK